MEIFQKSCTSVECRAPVQFNSAHGDHQLNRATRTRFGTSVGIFLAVSGLRLGCTKQILHQWWDQVFDQSYNCGNYLPLPEYNSHSSFSVRFLFSLQRARHNHYNPTSHKYVNAVSSLMFVAQTSGNIYLNGAKNELLKSDDKIHK